MRFRFSIREVLLLTAVLALAIAWWLDHRQLSEANERLNEVARPMAAAYGYSDSVSLQVRALKLLEKSYSKFPDDPIYPSVTDDQENSRFLIVAPEPVQRAIHAALDAIEESSSAEKASTMP